MRPRLAAFALLSLAAAGCSARGSSYEGPTGQLIAAAADRNHVPRDLMAAIASIEGGLRLAPVRQVEVDEAVPVAGVLELRHGRYNSLARGAALMERAESDLVADLALGTEAGARVLADLAPKGGGGDGDLGAWAASIEELSGHLAVSDRVQYRAKVFALLRAGGTVKARGGETITIAPHDDVPLDLTIAPPPLAALGTPEFPGATWFETPSDGKWQAGRGGYPITMIAIHDTEGGWDASVATLQNDTGKSVHYIVDADGSRVGQFVAEADTAYHAGNFYYNEHMVGIEHVGYASDDDYQTPMYEKSAELVRSISHRHNLGPNADGTHLDRNVLVGHQEIPNGNAISSSAPPCPDSPGSCVKNDDYGGANNHRDPGVNWEWCQYAEIIGEGAHCKCNDAFTHFNCTHDKSEAVKCADGVHVEYEHCASASCMIQPVGVDDTCGIVDPTTSSSSVASGAGGGGGTGGASGTGGAGAGSGGAGGSGAGGLGGNGGDGAGGGQASTGSGHAHGSTGSGKSSSKSSGEGSGCSASAGSASGSGLGGAGLLMALGLGARSGLRRRAEKFGRPT